MITFKKITVALIIQLLFLRAYTQKLPQVQQVSLRAPADIKIDGKSKEWGDKFQAYNKATGVFYTMSNDDENLYLVIYSNNFDITNKILNNGVNISFNAKRKSKEKSVLIKYPLQPSTRQENDERTNLLRTKLTDEEGIRSADEKKSARLSMNKAIAAANKHVRIYGVNALTDTLFSIYDAKGVTVRMECPRENLVYYELAIPLKYLEIPPAALPKIYYNIQLNESRFSSKFTPIGVWPTLPGGNDYGTVMYTTDFWGEYTLAK